MEYSKVSQEIFNKVNENVKSLEQLFPSVVKDGEVDFEALKEVLGQYQEVGKEKYELTWAGKQNAKKVADDDVLGRTLKFIPEDSKDADTTENLYIEGDSLEALKLLRQNYYNSIKMIYIDPPYNTGNDFIYKDNFKMSEKESAELEGEILDNERLIINQKNSNRFHANWLNMLYPRLQITKDLLTNDGLIFISIDENEIANIRLILNEIFGESNFVGEFVWQSKKGGGGDVSNVVLDHQYVICYSKNINSDPVSKVFVEAEPLNLIDDKGPYRKGRELNKWGSNSSRQDRPTMYFPITGPNGEDVYPIRNDGSEGCWRWGKQKMIDIVADGDVLFEKREDSTFIVYEKIRSTDPRKKPYRTWLHEVGTNAEGSETVKSIFNKSLFDFPKPLSLLEHLVKIGTKDDNSIILDFFSGSSSTAHAIMKLNAQSGRKDKFIMVQIPEVTDPESSAFQLGYENICEIGKERIRRAGENIKANKEVAEDLDVGFKVFRVGDTNIRWTHEALGEGQITAGEAELTDKDMLDFMPGFTDLNVVYEIMLRQRDIPLSNKVEKLLDIGDRTFMFADSYAVCLEETITEELIERLAAMEPLPIKFVFRDSSFEDDISLKDETFRRLQLLIARNTGEEKKTYTVEFL